MLPALYSFLRYNLYNNTTPENITSIELSLQNLTIVSDNST